MFDKFREILSRVPQEHQAAVVSIISALEHLLQQSGPVLIFVEQHLPAILALLSSGFSVPAILAFIANIFPAVNPPTPA